MENTNKCVHCGTDCGKVPIKWEEKDFCCNGCVTVYQIIKNSNLDEYYKISDIAGVKAIDNEYSKKFVYLDNAEVRAKLIEFSEGTTSKVTLYIPAIHCSSCIWLLENLQKLNSNIIQSMVHFVKKEVTITFNEAELSLRQLVELLSSLHYIPLITLESVEKKINKSVNRQLLYKIGVAGFCFGNTMLASMPEYVKGSFTVEKNFMIFFGALNLILALPVFFYSANDYFLSAYKSLRRKVINIDFPIAIGIFALFAESAYQILSFSGAGYMDSLCGLVFFLLIGKWYQTKTYQALSFERDYKSYFPVAVTKLVEGEEISEPIKNLKSKDRILIRNQELIPTDSVLMKGEASIDYSFVTGESKAIPKQVGDLIYAGGKQMGSAIELEIIKEVEQSRLTQLWQHADNKQEPEKSEGITLLIDKVSKTFTFVVIALSLCTLIFWLAFDAKTALKAFSSVLIVACPCALTLSMPFAFGNTMRIFGKAGLFLKSATVVEKISHINTVVFDKTGTITQSNLKNIQFVGNVLSKEESAMVKSLTRHSTHPLSAILYTNIQSDTNFDVENYKEAPAAGISGDVNGKTIKIGSELFVTETKNETEHFASRVYVAIDNQQKGYFSIEPDYREGLKELIEDFENQNFEIHLISGDNDAEKNNLLKIFKDENRLHFNQSPADKLNYITGLKQQGKKVLMLGDGLNDAGALKESHVGFSIADDVYHFTPASDGILKAEQFANLHRFISKSKHSYQVVKMSLAISFLYNAVGLYFAVSGQLAPIIAAILMPASSVTVVAFVTLFTSKKV